MRSRRSRVPEAGSFQSLLSANWRSKINTLLNQCYRIHVQRHRDDFVSKAEHTGLRKGETMLVLMGEWGSQGNSFDWFGGGWELAPSAYYFKPPRKMGKVTCLHIKVFDGTDVPVSVQMFSPQILPFLMNSHTDSTLPPTSTGPQ